jgi:hypothetical protein
MVNSDALCPEYGVDNGMPFRLIAVACFEDRLVDIEMTSLDEAISMQVITRNADVVDMISPAEVLKGLQPWHTIVGNDFRKSAPAPNEAVHEPIGESFSSFLAKSVEFKPMD